MLLDKAHNRVDDNLRAVLGFPVRAYYLAESISANNELTAKLHIAKVGGSNPIYNFRRLLKFNFIEEWKPPHKKDGRCIYYRLTVEGREWLREIRPAVFKVAQKSRQSDEVVALREVLSHD